MSKQCTRVELTVTGTFIVKFSQDHNETVKPYILYKQCEKDSVVDAIDDDGNVYHWCVKCAEKPTCGAKIVGAKPIETNEVFTDCFGGTS